MDINYCNAHKQPNQKSKKNWTPKWTWWEAWTAAGSRRSKSNTKTPLVKKRKKQSHIQPWTRHNPPVIIDKFLPTINTRRYFFCQNSGSGRTRSSGKLPPRNQSPNDLMTDPTKKRKSANAKHAIHEHPHTHTHTHKTESSTITSRLMRYHMTELPTKQHSELWASNRKKQTNNSKSPPPAHNKTKKRNPCHTKTKGERRTPTQRATQKRVSRERRRKTHQRRQGSEYRDLTWTLNCFFHTKNTRLLGIQQTKTSPLSSSSSSSSSWLSLSSSSSSSSSFVYILIPPPKYREGKGFQQQI